ncbi:MAG: amidohydrolase family protein, partial [Pseudomonadota bacterium]
MPPWLVRTDLLYPTVDGVDSVLRAVRQSVKMNTDWIKFTATGGGSINTWDKQQFNDEEMKALINEAHEKARPVSAHCMWAKGTLAAVKLGADTVEHGGELTPEILELMIKKGIFLIPTLYAPQTIAQRGHEFGFSPERVENVKKTAEKHAKSFRLALEAGVKIALGTDAGYGPPIHGTNAYELQLLVENGMSPMQALMSATSTAAQLMRLHDKIGTVEKGKLADIIVVDGNPLADITILQKKERIGLVMKEGTVYINRMGA